MPIRHRFIALGFLTAAASAAAVAGLLMLGKGFGFDVWPSTRAGGDRSALELAAPPASGRAAAGASDRGAARTLLEPAPGAPGVLLVGGIGAPATSVASPANGRALGVPPGGGGERRGSSRGGGGRSDAAKPVAPARPAPSAPGAPPPAPPAPAAPVAVAPAPVAQTAAVPAPVVQVADRQSGDEQRGGGSERKAAREQVKQERKAAREAMQQAYRIDPRRQGTEQGGDGSGAAPATVAAPPTDSGDAPAVGDGEAGKPGKRGDNGRHGRGDGSDG